MPTKFTADDPNAIPLDLVAKDQMEVWLNNASKAERAWINAVGFTASAGQTIAFPDPDGGIAKAAVGMGNAKDAARARFILAKARSALPVATYRLTVLAGDFDPEAECLGWLLAGYCYTNYARQTPPMASLVGPDVVPLAKLEAIAAGETLTRDLINTPASDMGPLELEAAARNLAQQFGADVDVIAGPDLLDKNFPMIHAVGRASDRGPRLIDMRWGTDGPKIAIVGKGVCFDTGGLNIKPGGSMGLMKKDMGGAATVLGLAHMIMALELPVQLRVLIPAVENAISGTAFRPQDILTARNGLTVEINNTDAEGRLVLADALTYAQEDEPDLIISMATLTGAARVAVGPDLAPFYATQSGDAVALKTAGKRVSDPVWEMPFWDPYEPMIEPGIADLDNAPKGGFAGSITAALFLRRFVQKTDRYIHFDIYGWQPTSAPARPKGGVGQGARAVLDALPDMLGI